jgi:nitroimidazol reductase NimA-like FMN-containing flavoprotein (pyridoxamine 5'-phosphate oxidase superfamily)
MSEHQLSREQAEKVLLEASTGALATIGKGGAPYAVPAHFVFFRGKIYLHGNPAGTKTENLKADPRVSFTAWREEGLIHAGAACDTNTRFQSAVVSGKARVFADREAIPEVLGEFVRKYTPQHAGVPLPPGEVEKTGVIEIDVLSITGKYFT